ncbi:hypothetical protein [Aquitalea sp. USM4]|uniref:hypothetical protein n=1 Tax=Aquitalea sp. USM4 TaxID=1590041 RepID=UPI00103B863D|nr:hypothetical protein [Aquitalea sp. USM4]QBJ78213.1 hypothetical protein DKK66_09010 [Aquitalea sp. USM4]
MKIQAIRHSATRLADLRFNRRIIALALIVASITSCQQVDATPAVSHNRAVLFNSGTEISLSSNTKADSRPMRHFLRPDYAIGASISMAGRGGSIFGCAGSLVPVRLIPPRACHPRLASDGGYKLTKEATMPKLSRALSRLFPISSTISTAATLAEAQTIARQHLAKTGQSVRIEPASRGYSVVEVA